LAEEWERQGGQLKAEYDGWEPKDYLVPEEVKALIEEANYDHHLLLVRLMADCGLRVSEACSADPEHLRKTEHNGIITWWLLVPHGKGDKHRRVPIPPGTAELLQRVGNAGITRQAIGEAIGYMAQRAGIDKKRCHPHMLRHSFAVEKLKQGMNLRNLQLILGHAHINNTQKYLKLAGMDIAEEDRRTPLRWKR